MEIYFGLIAFLIVLSFVCKLSDTTNNDRIVIVLFSVALFIIYVFRDYSVGRDIPGYVDIYESMSSHDLYDASWTWMEWGYVLLMKVFSMLGLSFRVFWAFIYAVTIIPLMCFIKKYSKDVTLSLIIFMCFQFFVFSMSALRQTMAMSICLTAYMVGNRNGLKSFIYYCLLIVLAVLIHRSAIVFAPAYFLMRWRLDFKMVFAYLTIIVVAQSLKLSVMTFLDRNGESENTLFNDDLSLGAFFVFMCLIILFSVLVSIRKPQKKTSYGIIESVFGHDEIIEQSLSNFLNLLTCCIVVQLVFQGFLLMRAAMFYEVFLLLVLPNITLEFSKEIRPFIKLAIIIGMVFIFYFSTLLPNELDIVPYKFF